MKKLLITSALLLVILLAASGYTGTVLKENQQAELEKITASNPELAIELEALDNGWFSSDYRYTVNFTLPNESQQTAVDVYVTHHHGPVTFGTLTEASLPSVGVSQYSWHSDAFAQLANSVEPNDPEAAEFLRQLPDLDGTGLVSFDGSNDVVATLPAFTIENSGGSISASEATLHAASTASGEITAAAMTLSQFTGQTLEEGAETSISLSQLTVDFSSTAMLAGMPIGNGEMQLGSFTLTSPGTDINLSNVSSTSTASLDGELLSYNTLVDIGGLLYNDIDISKSTIHTNYHNLHLPSIQQLQQIAQQFTPPANASEEQIQRLQIQQGEASQAVMLNLLLNKPKLDSQWQIGVFGEQASLDLDLNLDAITDAMAAEMKQNPATGILQMTAVAAGQLQLSLPQPLVDAVATYAVDVQAAADPTAPAMTAEQKQQTAAMMAQMPVMMGYLIENNGSLEAELTLANGQTTLNGKPFPIMQLISQYAGQMAEPPAQ